MDSTTEPAPPPASVRWSAWLGRTDLVAACGHDRSDPGAYQQHDTEGKLPGWKEDKDQPILGVGMNKEGIVVSPRARTHKKQAAKQNADSTKATLREKCRDEGDEVRHQSPSNDAVENVLPCAGLVAEEQNGCDTETKHRTTEKAEIFWDHVEDGASAA